MTATVITASTNFSGSGSGLTNIPFSALPTLTASQVVITDGSGVLSTESKLSPALGGTGQDFSGIGAGPFLPTISSGVFSASLAYSQAATANALVQMGGSGAITVGTVNTIALATTGNLTITSSGAGSLTTGVMPIQQAPNTITGGTSTNYVANISTANNTATTIFTLATASNTSYTIFALLTWGRFNGDTASQTYTFKVKNLAGTLTISSFMNNTFTRDASLNSTNSTATSSSANLLIRVNGLAGNNVNWNGSFKVLAQTLPLS